MRGRTHYIYINGHLCSASPPTDRYEHLCVQSSGVLETLNLRVGHDYEGHKFTLRPIEQRAPKRADMKMDHVLTVYCGSKMLSYILFITGGNVVLCAAVCGHQCHESRIDQITLLHAQCQAIMLREC